MNMKDSKNGIEHKCPHCGYEVEWSWRTVEGEFVKGDESFITIENNCGKFITFETDKPRHIDYGEPAYEKVLLLGCPKCGVVSYKIW